MFLLAVGRRFACGAIQRSLLGIYHTEIQDATVSEIVPVPLCVNIHITDECNMQHLCEGPA